MSKKDKKTNQFDILFIVLSEKTKEKKTKLIIDCQDKKLFVSGVKKPIQISGFGSVALNSVINNISVNEKMEVPILFIFVDVDMENKEIKEAEILFIRDGKKLKRKITIE